MASYRILPMLLFIALQVFANSTQEAQRNVRAAPTTILKNKWPGGKVPYEIDASLFSGKNTILKALRMIEDSTCVRFVPRTNENDWVRYVKSTKCDEPVGRQGGLQIIYVKISECGYLGFFLHMTMETLGFHHEHQRFDRDEHIKVYWENIRNDQMDAFAKLSAASHTRNSKYDEDSISHYGSFQHSKNGKPTIKKIGGGYIESIAKRAKLSTGDINGINTFYKCLN